MKKRIALLLSLVLLLCFTACGKLSAEGQKVSAMLTGQNTKTVKLTVKGDLLDGAKTVMIPADEGGATFAESEIKKDKNGKLVVKFKGLEPGSGIVSVSCKKDDETLCEASFLLMNREDGKLDFGALEINEGEFAEFETSGENKEEAAEAVRIPKMGGSDLSLIFLERTDGEWIADFYDAAVVEPLYMGDSEDGYSKFQVLPVAAGESDVLFINRGIMKKVLAKYEVKEAASAEGGEKTYVTTIKDYVLEDYTLAEYAARRERPEYEEKIKLFDPSFRVPDGCIIKGFSLFNYADMNSEDRREDAVFTFPDGADLSGIVLPETVDTASIELECNDLLLGYQITKARKLKKFRRDIEELNATESMEELTVGDRTITYYQTTYGFGIAIWEDDFVRQITFVGEKQTKEGNKELLKELLK